MSIYNSTVQSILHRQGVNAGDARIILATDMGDQRDPEWDELDLTFLTEALAAIMSHMHPKGIAEFVYVTDLNSGLHEVDASDLSDIVRNRHHSIVGSKDLGNLLDLLATIYRTSHDETPLVVFVVCDGSGSEQANRLHRVLATISDLPIFVSFITHSAEVDSFTLQRFIAGQLNSPNTQTGGSITHILPYGRLDSRERLKELLEDAAAWLRTRKSDAAEEATDSLAGEMIEGLAENRVGILLGRALAGLSRFTHRVADKVDDLMERYSDTVD